MKTTPEPTAHNPVPSGVEGQRTFTLNSPEAYAALCPRQDEPWIANGALPREPRPRDLQVIVERNLPSSLAGPVRGTGEHWNWREG